MSRSNLARTDFRQRAILITGCSSGIGLCVAEGLHARGYTVFATARRTEDVAKLRERGMQALHLDLNDSISIRDAVHTVLEHTGGTLYGLFNNGAYGQPGAVEDLRREVLRAQFETNLFGTVELTNAVLPIMRRQGFGRIIQNSSILGLIALPYRGAYNATKFALEGLTDTLRLELHGSGIYVSLVEPGPIRSKFRDNALRTFEAHIDVQNSAHKNAYEGLEARLRKEGAAAPFTLGPEAVLRKVIHALESPKPKIRYYVTFPTHLFGFLRRALPARLLDRVLQRTGGGGRH